MATVTTSDDVVDGNDGVLSLREALLQGGGAIDFAPFVQSSTIVLNGKKPVRWRLPGAYLAAVIG